MRLLSRYQSNARVDRMLKCWAGIVNESTDKKLDAMAVAPYQCPVSEGVCSYDGGTEYPVFVIEQNYDYFHSMYEADGMLESGELPQLNSEGKAYYLFFGELPKTRPFSVSKMGTFASSAEARGWAQEHLSYFVRWL